MAGVNVKLSYDFGVPYPGSTSSVRIYAKEDLLTKITNISPYDTPFVTQAPKVTAAHIYHEWLIDTLGTVDTTTYKEGEDWNSAYVSAVTGQRDFNICNIIREDIGVSDTQRAVSDAGFSDAYGYQMNKAGKRLAIKTEKLCFLALSSASGTSGAARVMKNFQNFVTTNVAYAGTGATQGGATSPGQLVATDIADMLDRIYQQGGNPEQAYCGVKAKRQISSFTNGTGFNRNMAGDEKKLINAIDFYDSDFGLIQLVLDRWIPDSIATGTGTATSTATAAGTTVQYQGSIWFLTRAMNRLAWLRPLEHKLIGIQGDGVAGFIRGEFTMECLNEKANGWLKSVNNWHPATPNG
jgi:hypothetical protein